MKSKSLWFTTLCAVALLAACSGMKQPATQAVASAEASLSSLRNEAAKYAPDALQSVESQVASLKESLAKKDYKAVIAASPGVTSAIVGLKDSIAAKKAELQNAWQSVSADLPKMVEAIQSRLDILSSSRKLPKGLDKSAFESAKSQFEALKSGWAEASNAFSAGNTADAISKAQALKEKATQIMSTLGMSSGT